MLVDKEVFGLSIGHFDVCTYEILVSFILENINTDSMRTIFTFTFTDYARLDQLRFDVMTRVPV